MSGLVRLKRLDLWTRRRGFGKASLVSFEVNPRLRLELTLNSTRLALLGNGGANTDKIGFCRLCMIWPQKHEKRFL